jgi:hypothetical protein
MGRRIGIVSFGMIAVAAAGIWTWTAFFQGEDRVIRRRLNALATEINEGTVDGVGLVARAAMIGSFFTDDVLVDLGRGTAPIHGRETVVGMAARLQPRTAAFKIALDDVDVDVAPDGAAADVNLTATFTRQEAAPAERTIDAREFRLRMKKVRGNWLIANVTAVEPLK